VILEQQRCGGGTAKCRYALEARSGRRVASGEWFVRGEGSSASHGTPDSGRPQSEAISTERLLIRTWLGCALLEDDQAGGTHYARLTSGGGGSRFHGRI
jgi:hypothetical protein